MEDEKSELLEVVADVSQFAGALASATVVAGKKLLSYVNDLTTVDTVLKPPTDKEQKSEVKSSKINTEVD